MAQCKVRSTSGDRRDCCWKPCYRFEAITDDQLSQLGRDRWKAQVSSSNGIALLLMTYTYSVSVEIFTVDGSHVHIMSKCLSNQQYQSFSLMSNAKFLHNATISLVQ